MVGGVANVDRPALAGIRSVRMADKVIYPLSQPDQLRYVQEV